MSPATLDERAFTEGLGTAAPPLLRLCVALTGETEAAQDLFQDTLLEAWRQRHKVWDLDGLLPWLRAIARLVYRRWRAQHRSAECHEQPLLDDMEERFALSSGRHSDGEACLEQIVAREHIDQLLASLPLTTRRIVLAKYVYGASHEAIGLNLGIAPSAVSMRLQRARQSLERVAQAAEADTGDAPQGQVRGRSRATQLWCPYCGQERLTLTQQGSGGAIGFRCPRCSSHPLMHIGWSPRLDAAHELQSPRAIANRLFAALHYEQQQALDSGSGSCISCHQPARLRYDHLPGSSHVAALPDGWYLYCDSCRRSATPFPTVDRTALTLSLPITQRFWRTHRRVRVLPAQLTTYCGQAAVLIRYRDTADRYELALISDAATCRVLQSYETLLSAVA